MSVSSPGGSVSDCWSREGFSRGSGVTRGVFANLVAGRSRPALEVLDSLVVTRDGGHVVPTCRFVAPG